MQHIKTAAALGLALSAHGNWLPILTGNQAYSYAGSLSASLPLRASTPLDDIVAPPSKRFNDPMNAAKGLRITHWLGTG